MKVLLFIRSLELGGAERQLLNLASRLAVRHEVVVVTFYGSDEYQMPAAESAYRHVSLAKTGRWDVVPFLTRFVRVVGEVKPDVVYAFMGSASLVALLARLAATGTRVVWGLRSSDMRPRSYGRLQAAVRRAECRLSAFADLVIANSEAGREQAIADGYRSREILVIPNGIDTVAFARDERTRDTVREELGVPATANFIAAVARHDPMKGLEFFLDAAARYAAGDPDARFLVVGSGPQDYTAALARRAERLGLGDRIAWLPKTNRVARYYNAMDVFTSASIYGEGFSNATAEAMSCEVPCVVTDVGDARHVAGEQGIVVRSQSAEALALGWTSVLARSREERLRLGQDSRWWIETKFGVEVMASATEIALRSVVERPRATVDRGVAR